jgi:hypothetical protein
MCCSRAEHSSTVILKRNMFSVIYNVWIKVMLQWQPEPLNCNGSGRFGALKSDSTHHFFKKACTKSGSLRFSLIIMYSQDYNYTLKYSYGHYMVFVVSVTIFSVLHYWFCLQLFILFYPIVFCKWVRSCILSREN